MASDFEKAFASARKGGKSTFSYKGKSYNTKLASDTPKKGPMPTSRQGQDKGSGGRSTGGTPASIPGASVQKKVSSAPKGPSGEARYNQGSSTVRYKRDGSIASKATAFVAGVARDGLANTVKKAVSGGKKKSTRATGGGGGW